MAGIRVNASIKKIEVNDSGDFITLNFSDSSLPERFFAMLERIQKLANDTAEKQKTVDTGDTENMFRTSAALYRETHEMVMQEVDAFFGPDTCRHVFGDIVPDLFMFNDFFEQLIPYFNDYAKDRAAKLSKYDPARTGNV